MRKYVGLISFTLQTGLFGALAGGICLSRLIDRRLTVWEIVLFALFVVYTLSSLCYKMIYMVTLEKKSNKTGLRVAILGVLFGAAYLIIMNPNPLVPDTTGGLIVTILILAFFIIDAYDAVYQYSCKL